MTSQRRSVCIFFRVTPDSPISRIAIAIFRLVVAAGCDNLRPGKDRPVGRGSLRVSPRQLKALGFDVSVVNLGICAF